jgi:hypothetical protein
VNKINLLVQGLGGVKKAPIGRLGRASSMSRTGTIGFNSEMRRIFTKEELEQMRAQMQNTRMRELLAQRPKYENGVAYQGWVGRVRGALSAGATAMVGELRQ